MKETVSEVLWQLAQRGQAALACQGCAALLVTAGVALTALAWGCRRRRVMEALAPSLWVPVTLLCLGCLLLCLPGGGPVDRMINRLDRELRGRFTTLPVPSPMSPCSPRCAGGPGAVLSVRDTAGWAQ